MIPRKDHSMKTTGWLSVLSAPVVVLVMGALMMADAKGPLGRLASRKRELPGDDVEWIRYPAQNEQSNSQWGDFLTDVAQHLPSQYGDHYSSNDRITHAHETTHGINSHIINHLRHDAGPPYGFYVGNNHAILLRGPRAKRAQPPPLLPESLHCSRYQPYCIKQRKYFHAHPICLFDEC